MITTIYELLGMIKDGKAPKKIKVTGTIYEYDEESKFYFAHFKTYSVALGGKEDDINLLYNVFNEDVEILDEPKENFTGWKMYQDGKVVCSIEGLKKEDKIEYLEKVEDFKFVRLIDKINELIDEVNKLKEK